MGVESMKIYNTMSRKKEDFEPANEKRIKLFVCGPTVYDDAHIGHARTYISFDIIKRYLEFKGFFVFYLQNITDIDDKIINRAVESNIDPEELARKYEKLYLEDMEFLGVNGVNIYARARDHIPEIISQIQTLIENGFAYETETGVYFEEDKFPDYGKLSRRNLEDLTVHRVNIDPTKKNPADFALWKKRTEKPLWDSPWGTGRPGWHIEDTAITEEYFGPQYDIHGGGLDLIFPHHEAEIAQIESASGKSPMVKYWMHTGFLNVSGEKMSKSLGNFITIRKLLENHDPQVFRFFVLSTHYRSPIDFSVDALEQSEKSLNRIQRLLIKVNEALEKYDDSDNDTPTSKSEDIYLSKIDSARDEFINAMDNDFNTPLALSGIFNFIREFNKDLKNNNLSKNILQSTNDLFDDIGSILGFNFFETSSNNDSDDISQNLIDILLEVRQKLREGKNYELSDEIRNKLAQYDINLED